MLFVYLAKAGRKYFFVPTPVVVGVGFVNGVAMATSEMSLYERVTGYVGGRRR